MTSLTTSPTTATAALGVAPTTQQQNQVVYPGYPGMQPSTRRGIGRTWLTKAAACRVRLACDIMFVPRTLNVCKSSHRLFCPSAGLCPSAPTLSGSGPARWRWLSTPCTPWKTLPARVRLTMAGQIHSSTEERDNEPMQNMRRHAACYRSRTYAQPPVFVFICRACTTRFLVLSVVACCHAEKWHLVSSRGVIRMKSIVGPSFISKAIELSVRLGMKWWLRNIGSLLYASYFDAHIGVTSSRDAPISFEISAQPDPPERMRTSNLIMPLRYRTEPHQC